MEDTPGSASRSPIGISQALLTALAARGRPYAPGPGSGLGSGLGPGLGSGLGPFDPNSAQIAGRSNHGVSSGSDLHPTHTEGMRGYGSSMSSAALTPTALRGTVLGPSIPSSAVGSPMTDLD